MKATVDLYGPEPLQHSVEMSLRNFIEKEHPCIMANHIFSSNSYEIHIHGTLGSKGTAKRLLKELEHYVDGYDFTDRSFRSFIAVFPDVEVSSEVEFENLMWRQLQFVHDIDEREWDSRVSSEPTDSKFSFSIAGRAFYIVGMHPKSSRMARRSPHPCMVFNLHWQFEKLREMGAYHKVRDKIRSRDEALQGTVNPMLEDFGRESEARQYSGRKVGSFWKCPFHQR